MNTYTFRERNLEDLEKSVKRFLDRIPKADVISFSFVGGADEFYEGFLIYRDR